MLERIEDGDTASLLRIPSEGSGTQSEEDTIRSERSADVSSIHRQENLASVGIRLHAEPPDYVKAAIDRIINQEISEDRQVEIHFIAEKFTNSCLESVRALSGERDFTNPLYFAIQDLKINDLCTRRQADWREDLKPVVSSRDSEFSSSFIATVRPETEFITSPPRKRLKHMRIMSPGPSMANTRVSSPVNLQGSTTIPPPMTHSAKNEDYSSVKPPRPDISMGIKLTALISALSSSLSNNLSSSKAERFLTWLQKEMVVADGLLEPMLISIPALSAQDLAFPFAVVESNAYSTGKQIFEAENQAVVSAACALKIQLDLDDLVKYARTGSGNASHAKQVAKPALFFFICTKGPIHELWVSWTVIEDQVRKYRSKLVSSCNALVPELAEKFLMKLNNVSVWGTGSFKDSAVERLEIVAKLASQSES